MYSQSTLFVSCNTHLDLSVFHGCQNACRQIVTLLTVDRIYDVSDHPRSGFVFDFLFDFDVCPFGWNRNFFKAFHAGFHGLDVLLYDRIAFCAIFILDRSRHFRHCLLYRNDFHDGEER